MRLVIHAFCLVFALAVLTPSRAEAAAIHEAVKIGSVTEVQSVLAREPGAINAPDADGKTPLILAASRGYENIVGVLLAGGADKAAIDKEGLTALHMAAVGGHLAVAKRLLDAGAAIDSRDKLGGTPLLLVAAGRVMNSTRDAAGVTTYTYQSNEPMARLLLERGANPQSADNDGRTPLHMAAASGNSEIVTLLLAAKVPVDPRQKTGYTPLHFAATLRVRLTREEGTAKIYEFFDNTAAAQLLIAAKADVNAVGGDNGITPLMLAASEGSQGVVEALLAAHADLKLQAKDGKTALHFAGMGQRWVTMRIWKEGERENRDMRYVDNKSIIIALLKAGADPAAKTKDGKTPLELAKAEYKSLNVKAFEEYGK